jgi:hypothetical protein
MLSNANARPVLATAHDENAASRHGLTVTSKTIDSMPVKTPGLSKMMGVKTPGLKTTGRRALGDISNRKAAAGPTTTIHKQTTATSSKPAAESTKVVTSALKPVTTKAAATRPYYAADATIVDDVEVTAGRTYAQEQALEGGQFDFLLDGETSMDAEYEGERVHWDTFFQDMDRQLTKQFQEKEAKLMRELDEHVERVMKLDDGACLI